MRGFIPYSNEEGRVTPWEYLPCSAITPKIGMAMTMNSGKLAIATGTTKPTYICMAEYDAAVTAGTIVPVIRVQADEIFEVTNSASLSGVNVGQKVTLHASNGLQITGTTTSGVAELVDKEADASGSRCLVRFS
jgi:hypothetical protein